MTTRCKFRCSSVTKRLSGEKDRPHVYDAEFSAVSSGSEENKKFFHWTPSGTLKVSAYREDLFKPGEEYYIDISEILPVLEAV